MDKKELAIKYFESNRKIFCEDILKHVPKDSIAHYATIQEQEYYDMAIEALIKESTIQLLTKEEVAKDVASVTPSSILNWLNILTQLEMCGFHICKIKEVKDEQ